MRLYVAPAAKVIRVAAGRMERARVEVAGAEVTVEIDGVDVGSGVAVDVDANCVGLAKGVTACRVSANVVEIESAEGMDVTEPPQAIVAKISIATATIDKVGGFSNLIFSPCLYRYCAQAESRWSDFAHPLAIQSGPCQNFGYGVGARLC